MHYDADQLVPPHPYDLDEGDDGVAPLLADELEAFWGPPDERTIEDDGSERWVYVTNELTWAGIMPVIIILPLPLMLPIGHASARFELRDGIVTGVDITHENEATALVGFIMRGGMCPSFSFSMFETRRYTGDTWLFQYTRNDVRELRAASEP